VPEVFPVLLNGNGISPVVVIANGSKYFAILPKVESNVPGCAKDNEAVKIEISNASKMTVFHSSVFIF
jgi:hypothetical protein